MSLNYLKEGESQTLKDGTLVEHTEKGIVVHNNTSNPKSKSIRRYSSVLSAPTLNHSSSQCRDFAKGIYKNNRLEDFTMEDLLHAIEILHGCGKFLGHPHITLHGDGSGKICGKYEDDIYQFKTIREFIEKANEWMKEMEPEPKEKQLMLFNLQSL
jgi:hypothetical protein